MKLAEVNQGEKFKIKNIPDDRTRVQALRFGLSSGAKLTCDSKIPGGPIIIKRNLQEIAIGRKLAEKISITK
ncbi:MAG: FeoA family protein [Bacillota bacterium]